MPQQLAQYIQELLKDWGQLRQVSREITWQRCLDAFKGEDADFWQFVGNDEYWAKKTDEESWRSQVYVRMTRTKVISALAIVSDVVLQGGQIPFTLTPKEDGIPDSTQRVLASMGYPVPNPDEIQAQAENMMKRIQSQFATAKIDRELMKVVLSMALYGEGYMKAPFVEQKDERGFDIQADESGNVKYSRKRESTKIPSAKYVSVWDIYRDFETPDIQDGIGVIQRSLISPFQLRKKVGAAYFDNEMIEQVISGAAAKTNIISTQTLPPHLRNITNRRNNIIYLEFWGRAPIETIEEYYDKTGNDIPSSLQTMTGRDIEIHSCLANDEIVRIVGNPEERRPYCFAMWEDGLDDSEGTGIAENVKDSQATLNDSVRTFIDNKKLSGNVMLAGQSSSMAPGENKKMHPGKWFELAEHIDDVRKALQVVVVPDVGESLMSLINLAERYGDEESGLPKVLQGDIAEKKKPDTLGEMNILVSQAGKYLGQVIRNLDEGVIEPLSEWFYEWNMLREQEVQAILKVNATGFSSFQNRIIRGQNIQNLLQLVLSAPVLTVEARIRPMLEEIFKGMDVDPDTFLKSEEEKMQERLQQMQEFFAQQQALAPQGGQPVSDGNSNGDLRKKIEEQAEEGKGT